MQYVFGPVPSRRLGRSLGIDPVAFKSCNWNCVYCQLGRSSSRANPPSALPPLDAVLAEIREAIALHGRERLDWVTFVGSGETTLHGGLGRMIAEVKSLTNVPVAVITNGSRLDQQEVRRGLLLADAVLPTLDAGSERLYLRIDRPRRQLTFARLVDGLVAFRREYHGPLWVEVMLIRGVNDSPEALRDLARVLSRIGADEVHLNLPVRPPAEPWVEPADETGLTRAVEILGSIARVVRPMNVQVELSDGADLEETIAGVVARHPMSQEQLVRSLAASASEIAGALDRMRASGRIGVVSRQGQAYFVGPGARHGANTRKPLPYK